MEVVNYIKHLNSVFERFAKDNRLNPTHISLYLALFQIWNNNRFMETFYINRDEVMLFSKIGSKSTYHRCLKELDNFGYILYLPSHNPFKGSRIKLFRFGTTSGQVANGNNLKLGQASVSSYKQNKKIENNLKQKKRNDLNILDSENYKNEMPAVPNKDNLKTSRNKNYDEPL